MMETVQTFTDYTILRKSEVHGMGIFAAKDISKGMKVIEYVGDKVTKDDDIVELVTDKATFLVPSGALGTLKEIRFHEGQEVEIGEVLAVIEK